ncbi:MAG: hypothetical protein Q8891_00100 [Bacteroidota bacterium]|nr:hypothetical protein [Bacteroidota bacterium]
MKHFFLKYLKFLIEQLQKIYNKYNEGGEPQLPYVSLSPVSNADISNDYKKALDWALENRKENDIKNIALTGPYGSGKSSILKTYIKEYSGKDLHFLHISLATFKEEIETSDEPVKGDLLRLIELSILQQIFYFEEDKKIPDSRFRKIKNYTRKNLLITTAIFFLVTAALVNLIYPQLYEHLLNFEFKMEVWKYLRYLSFFVVVISFLVIIFRSIRMINGIKINKLNIQNAEISINENVNKSILNNHLDEILYFFEVTDYNVVIIEDLDRFKQTEIFTKLREINLLINNSKKIKKEVVFIYAVRDDMFKTENERTKFFDFIIPVIPIINSSNSSQKLLEKQSKYNYDLSENLIDSISLFIDDMRLLNNISNEFYLYRQKLNKGLSQDNLLAMIVYKNIFPSDFTLLSNSKGELFKSINNKNNYILENISKTNEKINGVKEEIKNLENIIIKDIKELRFLYLLSYIPHLPGFVSFSINYGAKTIDDMANDENFEYIINNKATYNFFQSYSQQNKALPIQFIKVEKQLDRNRSYVERKQEIEDLQNNKIDLLKNELKDLEKEKSHIRNLRVRELIDKQIELIQIEDSKQKNLVNILLRNGFIDEDYLDYISIFYEGSITKDDHQFLINVKSQIATDYNFKLNKIDKLIQKINPFEFEKEYALNYSLLDYVLNQPKNVNTRDKIFKKLKDESESSMRFIDGFIDIGENIELFIVNLIENWPQVWQFLENKSNFTEERKDDYFNLIIEFAKVDDLVKLYENPFFKKRLLQQRDFLNIIPNRPRLKQIVESLKIKFVDLDINQTPKELVDFIYEKNWYEINISMLRFLLQLKDKFNEIDFGTRNYFAIKNSGCDNLEDYINSDINTYVDNVYLRIDANVNENEESLIELLNNEGLTVENKSKIIAQIQTVVSVLSTIDELEIKKLLVQKSKIAATWENVFNYYQNVENEFDPVIIAFLEKDGVALELSKKKIEKDVEGEKKYIGFITKLLTNDDIRNEIYQLLLKSIPYRFSNLDFSQLSEEKVRLLLNNILVFNLTNYKLLKDTFTDLHIIFLEIHKGDFIKNISDYELDGKDISLILFSNELSGPEKNKIIENADESLFSTDLNSLRGIGELILKDNSFRVSDSVLNLVIVNSALSIEQRIRIFYWKQNQVSMEYIDDFLKALGEPYSDITIKGKRPLFPNLEYNRKLIEVLNSRNYISKFDFEKKGIRISTFRKETGEEI